MESRFMESGIQAISLSYRKKLLHLGSPRSRAPPAVTMKRFLQILEQTAKVVLVTAVILWLCDWAVFRVRLARGTAFDSVQVEEYLSTALKGNKQEYDYMGVVQV